MTQVEQIALANEKVAHWTVKQEKAQALLTKWQHQLAKLQAKGKPVATADRLPPLVIVPGTQHLMPRGAVITKGDQAKAEHLAREAAMADIAKAADEGKVVPLKGKAKPVTKPKKSKLRGQPTRASFPPRSTFQREAHANRSADQKCRLSEPAPH